MAVKKLSIKQLALFHRYKFDPLYKSYLIMKLINNLNKNGKKNKILIKFYRSLRYLRMLIHLENQKASNYTLAVTDEQLLNRTIQTEKVIWLFEKLSQNAQIKKNSKNKKKDKFNFDNEIKWLKKNKKYYQKYLIFKNNTMLLLSDQKSIDNVFEEKVNTFSEINDLLFDSNFISYISSDLITSDMKINKKVLEGLKKSDLVQLKDSGILEILKLYPKSLYALIFAKMNFSYGFKRMYNFKKAYNVPIALSVNKQNSLTTKNFKKYFYKIKGLEKNFKNEFFNIVFNPTASSVLSNKKIFLKSIKDALIFKHFRW